MIDREQVLHVARLARLELTEDEVSRMTGELSAILDHIEKISTLDLDGVPPTTHVVDVPNALRPDEPRPSLPREVALSNAPAVDDDGFSVPRPPWSSLASPYLCRRHERRRRAHRGAGGGRSRQGRPRPLRAVRGQRHAG